jgi:hypothetical protein
MFGLRCQENGIEHRCTKINHALSGLAPLLRVLPEL